MNNDYENHMHSARLLAHRPFNFLHFPGHNLIRRIHGMTDFDWDIASMTITRPLVRPALTIKTKEMLQISTNWICRFNQIEFLSSEWQSQDLLANKRGNEFGWMEQALERARPHLHVSKSSSVVLSSAAVAFACPCLLLKLEFISWLLSNRCIFFLFQCIFKSFIFVFHCVAFQFSRLTVLNLPTSDF